MVLILIKVYFVIEEWFNSVSYGVGFVVVIVGLVFMFFRVEDVFIIMVVVIYGFIFIFMFLSLILYYVISY